MRRIYNIVSPYQDEHLLSWLVRLAIANGQEYLQFINDMFNLKKQKYKYIKNIGQYNIYSLLGCLRNDCDPIDLLLLTTTFGYEIISYKPLAQTKIVQNYFYDKDLLNTTVNSFFHDIYVCPECTKEDMSKYGFAYIHRKHQLTGISICHKHHVRLIKNNALIDQLNLINLNEAIYKEGSSNDELIKFAYDLLDANLDTNLNQIYQSFRKNNIELPLRYSYETGDLLQCLYKQCQGNIELLKKQICIEYIDRKEDTLLHKDSILRQYHCNKCGNDYVTCDSGYDIGVRCSYCREKSYQKRFEEMINLAGHGEYQVLSDFISINDYIYIKHKCGNIYKTKPRVFLYEGSRCICNYIYNYNEIKDRVEKNTQFKLIEYTRMDKPMKVKSTSCGHTFNVIPSKFFENPHCRICEPKKYDKRLMQIRLNKITNGEFKILNEWSDIRTDIRLLHNKCGNEFWTTPVYFLSHPVCPLCKSKFVEKWDCAFNKLNSYRKKYNSIDVPKRYTVNNFCLGEWCTKQRLYYKEGRLTEDKIQKLRSIGFAFDPKEDEWDRKFNLYKSYIKEKGTIDISRRTKYQGLNLGVWVAIQRKVFKAGKMKSRRLHKLEKINFKFN